MSQKPIGFGLIAATVGFEQNGVLKACGELGIGFVPWVQWDKGI